MEARRTDLVITLLAGIGVLGAAGVVASEIEQPGTCPRVLGIPACYIGLAVFLAIAVSPYLKPPPVGRWVFWVPVVAGCAMSLFGTVGELTGRLECPRFAGVPLCFLALALFLGLLVLRLRWPKAAA